jgi:hypothetical protein
VKPTGTLTVTASGPDGVAAEVTDLYARMATDDLVRPLPAFTLTPGAADRPATGDVRAPVIGFGEPHAVQTLGDYLFLGAGSSAGVRVGDVFEVVVDPGAQGEDAAGGRAQVVTVDGEYATARILHLENPVFETGVMLRLSRRMQ